MIKSVGLLAMFALVSSVGACGNDQDRDAEASGGQGNGDGSGGGSGASVGSGGAPIGTGGFSSGTGGVVQRCDSTLPIGSGGGVYTINCPEWMGEGITSDVPPGEDGVLDVSCSGGGQGGEGGESSTDDLPLLGQLCTTARTISETTLIDCLRETLDDPCSQTQEDAVYDCLFTLKPCVQDEPECAELLTQCPSLDASLCHWGMLSAKNSGRVAEVRQCMLGKGRGETCDDAFLRCQWGI